MLDIPLEGYFVYFGEEIWLINVGVLVGFPILVLNVGGFYSLFVVVEEAFDLFHFDETINLLGCEFAEAIFGGLEDLLISQVEFFPIFGYVFFED